LRAKGQISWIIMLW